jgi:hypothetical protein
MKTFSNLSYFLNDHITWEKAIERPLHRVDIHLALGLEVSHLAYGVDS